MFSIKSRVRVRARDIKIPFEGTHGKLNSITDVKGIEVGMTTIIDNEKGIRTGCTAIIPRGKKNKKLSPIWAGIYCLNGNGEMTGSHWIKDAGYFLSPIILTNTHSIGIAHHSVLKWMINNYDDFIDQEVWITPVVAETFDGVLNDIHGLHLKEEHVLKALETADSSLPLEGNSGGGTGMITYGYKGGTGTSSRIVKIPEIKEEYTLGVLVQANNGTRREFRVKGVPLLEEKDEKKIFHEDIDKGSIIIIIATDAPLMPNQLERIARRGSFGIARNGTSGNNGSGDIFLAFSTAEKNSCNMFSTNKKKSLEYLDDELLNYFYRATIEAIEEAVLNAMCMAEEMISFNPSGELIPTVSKELIIKTLKYHNLLKK